MARYRINLIDGIRLFVALQGRPQIMDGGRIFFQGGANSGFSNRGNQKDFCRGAKSSKFHFAHPETQKTISCGKLDGKMSNFKIQ